MDTFDTRVTVAVPNHLAGALEHTLAGPNCWSYAIPDLPANDPLVRASAHQRAHAHHQVRHNATELERAVRAAHPDHPAWMPVAKNTALAWAINPTALPVKRPTVGLSVVRLLPFTLDSWARRFPGTIDDQGWWEPSTDDHMHVFGTKHGWGPAALDTLGTDLPTAQFQDEPIVVTHEEEHHTIFVHQWRTDGRPVQGLMAAMRPILVAHQACALEVAMGDDDTVHLAHCPHGAAHVTTHGLRHLKTESTALQPVWRALMDGPLRHVHHLLLPT